MAERKKIVETFRFLDRLGLNAGRSGNISLRLASASENEEDLFLITPSGVIKRQLSPEDILLVNKDLDVIEGDKNPSVESPTHMAVYKARSDVKAIIHAHSIYASAFAVVRKPIPPILEELVYVTGGEISVTEYAQSGTDDLAKNIVDALGEKKAVLIANHGILTCGKDLDDALEVLISAERTAQVYILAKTLDVPKLVPSEVMSLEQELYRLKNME